MQGAWHMSHVHMYRWHMSHKRPCMFDLMGLRTAFPQSLRSLLIRAKLGRGVRRPKMCQGSPRS